MVDRSVEVRLRADISQFQRAMGIAGVETQTLTARLRALDGALDQIDRRNQAVASSSQLAARRLRAQDRATQGLTTSQGNLNTQLGNTNSQLGVFAQYNDNASRSVGRNDRSINQLTGRLGLAADAVLTLGSAFIPIGAVGAQAIGGLTAAVVSLALAGGTAILAFQGVGDAVKAVNEFQLDRTVANLEKAQEALHKLGPDAAAFVAEWQDFEPVLKGLQRAAAEGWFSGGMTDSLDDFAVVMPQIENLFRRIGIAGGDITKDIAESLASGEWDEFLDFLAVEAPSAMATLARATGSLTHGAAEMWMAFDPGNDRFLAWMEDAAAGFDRWASSAEGAEDIQAFLEYARENGPEVKAFFAALADATAQIVQAAAPLGGPTLTVLTKLLEVVAAFANSDLGTPFLTAMVALRLYTRGLALAQAAQARLAATPIVGAAAAAPRPGQAGFIGPLTQQQAAQQSSSAAAQRAAYLRSGVQGGAAIGAIALASSGLTEKMDSANTASMALLGTMIAPGWGTAAGAIVGGLMDITAANDAFVDSASQGTDALGRGDFGAYGAAIAKAREELKGLRDDAGTTNLLSPGDAPMDVLQGIGSAFGLDQAGNAADDLAALEAKAKTTREAVGALGEAFGMWVGPLNESARSTENLDIILGRLAPAMQRSGVEVEELARAYAMQKRLQDGTASFVDRAIASASGSTTPFDDFVDGLERTNQKMREAISLSDTFANSLAHAQGFLSRNGAIDAAYASWNNLKKSVKDNGDAFDRMTVKGQANRAALRQMGDAIGVASEKLHGLAREKFLDNMRQQFRDAADLLNLNATQTDRWMRQLGLLDREPVSPKVKLQTEAFDARVKHVEEQLARLEGRAPAKPQVGMDPAPFNKGKQDVESSAEMLDRLNPTPTVGLVANPFFNGAAGVRAEAGRLDALSPDILVTITTSRVNRVEQEIADRTPKPPSNSGGVEDRSSSGGRSYSGGAGFTPIYTSGDKASTVADPVDRVRQALESFRGETEDNTEETKRDKEETKKHREEVKRHHKALEQARRNLEKMEAKLADARAMRTEIGQSVSAAELTGGGLAGFDLGVSANTNDTRAFLRALAKASKKGLDGPLFDFLSASGDLQLVQEFAALSQHQIDQRENRYARLGRAQRQLGDYAVEEEFGKTVGELADATHDLAQTVKRLEHIDKKVEKGARDGTRDGNRERTRNTMTMARAGR